MALISSWSSSRQLAATQVTSYRWAMSERMARARSEAGLAALSLIQTGTTIRVLGVAALEGLTVPDGDPALMEQRGGILKDLTLRHRAETERLQQVYQEQKRKLLENIYEREETTI